MRRQNGTLCGKPAPAKKTAKNVLGWFIGYLEKDGSVYYFATSLQNERDADGSAATALTLEILESLGLYSCDEEADL